MAGQKPRQQIVAHAVPQQLHQLRRMTEAGGEIRGLRQAFCPGNGAQHAVDEAGRPGVGVFLALLHRLVDAGGGGDLVGHGELVDAQAQDIQHHGLQIPELPFEESADVEIQQHPVLQHPVAQAAGQGGVPAVQAVAGDVFLQDAVGPGVPPAAGDQRRQGGGAGAHGVSGRGWPRK